MTTSLLRWASSSFVIRHAARGAAVVGFVLGLGIMLGLGVAGSGGSAGTDALAYWQAGRSILDGSALYGGNAGVTSAYLYSPLFAQLVAPLSLLPAPVFVWLWRLLEVGCLRVAIGSWTRAGLAMLVFPPVIIELVYGNVNLMIAAVCALVMRGRAAPWGAPIVVKAAGIPLIPLAFKADWWTFIRAGAVMLVAVGVSIVLAPIAWSDYLWFLADAEQPTWWTNLSRDIPFAIRLLAAMGLGVVAVRWVRVAPIAVLVGLPIVWLSSVSILVATVAPLPETGHRTVETPLGTP